MQHLGWLLIAIIVGVFLTVSMLGKPKEYPLANTQPGKSMMANAIIIFVLGEMIYWGLNLMLNY